MENGGYSVSETDGDGDSTGHKLDAEMMSMNSGLSRPGQVGPLTNALMSSPDHPIGLAKDPNLAPFFPERFQSHFGGNAAQGPSDVEQIIR